MAAHRGDSDEAGFVVHHVGVQELEEVNSFVVGLSATADGSGDVLLLSIALSYDEQDSALGQTTYSLSTASGATVYGGILRCVLDNFLLTLELDAPAAAALGVRRLCKFPLNLDPAAIAQRSRGLKRVFAMGSAPPVELRL